MMAYGYLVALACLLYFLHFYCASRDLHDVTVCRGYMWGLLGLLFFSIPFALLAFTASALASLAMRVTPGGIAYDTIIFGIAFVTALFIPHLAARRFLGVREIGESGAALLVKEHLRAKGKCTQYVHPTYEAVRVEQGFSCAAFFWSSLWAAFNGMWRPHFLLMVALDISLLLLSEYTYAQKPNGSRHAFMVLFLALAYAFIRGLYGNRWRNAFLESQGYSYPSKA